MTACWDAVLANAGEACRSEFYDSSGQSLSTSRTQETDGMRSECAVAPSHRENDDARSMKHVSKKTRRTLADLADVGDFVLGLYCVDQAFGEMTLDELEMEVSPDFVMDLCLAEGDILHQWEDVNQHHLLRPLCSRLSAKRAY